MGSFNAACGVSRISIGGGPTVLIPLKQSRELKDFRGGAMIISNEGIKHTYSPFTLPIFGNYNSYGVIDNIEEDENTRAIEKYYKCSIQKFVDHVCRPWDEKNESLPKDPFGMFVHGDVYADFAKNVMSEYGKKETAASAIYMNKYTLQLLGFIRGEKDEKRQRYNVIYTHPKIPGLVLWSEDSYCEYEFNGESINDGIFHPDQLEKFLLKKKLFVPPQIKKLKDLSQYSVMFDENLEMFNQAKLDDALDDTTEKLQLRKMLTNLRWRTSIFRFSNRYSNEEDTFEPLYGETLNHPDFKKLFVDFMNFEQGMYFVNASYAPTWNGIQYGYAKATLRMAKLTAKIMKEEIKERNA